MFSPALPPSTLPRPRPISPPHPRLTRRMGPLEPLKLNRARGGAVPQLCEVGRIFSERNGQNFECAAAGFVIAEPVGERSWLKREPTDFYATKKHVAARAAAADREGQRPKSRH